MSVNRRSVGRTSRVPLATRERIDWHDHAVHQLCYPLRGMLGVATPLGEWIVPPHRAVWVPAGVPHAHRAHGPTEMRSLTFPARLHPLRVDHPAVLAVGPLLHEVIVAMSDAAEPTADPTAALTAGQYRNLERVALDQLRRVEELPLRLPWPRDGRLRDVTALLAADPADQRTLAELGRQVGAGERTLSRLFRAETGLTFPQWRTQLRLQHALTLLAAGEPVTLTAFACGFRSASAFIEVFRQAFGTTPGRHMEGHRDQNAVRGGWQDGG